MRVPASLRATFTTRRGGVSSGPYAERNLADHVGDDERTVESNRRALTAELGAERVVYMHQVHGTEVAFVDATATVVDGVDALVTATPGIAVAVLVADCVPVVLCGSRAVAVAHAGRRGMQHGVVARTVAALRELDDAPLRAWLGPSICGECYEVPAEMQAEVSRVVPPSRATTRVGTPALDLRRGIAAQLRDSGVDEIGVSDVCTAEDPAYFSYRRDGVTGRFVGAAIINP